MPLLPPPTLSANDCATGTEADTEETRTGEASPGEALSPDVAEAASQPQTQPPQKTMDAAATSFLAGHYDVAARLLASLPAPGEAHPVSGLFAHAIAQGRRAELLLLLDACQEIAPDDYRLFEHRGTILMQLGHLTEAEHALREAIARQPTALSPQNSLAMVVYECGRYEEAIALLEDISRAAPENWAPLCNLACILSNIGRTEEADQLYRRAIPLAPKEPTLRLNASIAMLKGGRLAQGWVEHEWRLDLPGHTSLSRETLLPGIASGVDLRGKRVLVTQEEGLGDTLMYLRYLPALSRTGAEVTVWGTETLAGLTARVKGNHRVQHGGSVPDYDYHCPFISLPRAFVATPDMMGAPVPYLSAHPVRAAQWARIMHRDRRLRVGLVWAGAARPDNTAAYMLDRRRSMPCSALAPLASLEGVSFYALQKDRAADEIDDFPGKIHDFMPQCLDMDDTAALIANLDIVVSVDTSIVHLAGGMGKTVIMMDRYDNCWRWMREREDSPWYPTLRIVRQTRFGDWSDVVTRVRTILDDAQRKHA